MMFIFLTLVTVLGVGKYIKNSFTCFLSSITLNSTVTGNTKSRRDTRASRLLSRSILTILQNKMGKLLKPNVEKNCIIDF